MNNCMIPKHYYNVTIYLGGDALHRRSCLNADHISNKIFTSQPVAHKGYGTNCILCYHTI